MLKQLFFILISFTGLSFFAKTPHLVPVPLEYHGAKGYFKASAAPEKIFVSPGSQINRDLTSEWVSELGIANTLTTDSAAAVIRLLLQPGVTGNAEGYTLEISPKDITICADSDKGLIWGLQTLRQLYNGEGRLQSCRIVDYPLYPWRSYLLDESRHFFGKDAAKKVIDELSRLKMNTLHWHLTDGAGWRIEIPAYPRLTEIGSKMDYSHRGITPEAWDSIHPERAYYNTEEIKEIVSYARDRGIKVVPEIDMPGHSLAAITAYPWLGTSSRYSDTPVIGDVLQVSDPEVEQFMRNTLSHVIDVFDADVVHIGGDEVGFKHWQESDGVKAFMAEQGFEQPWQLQHWFMKRMVEFLKSKGCTAIGWNEITGHGNDPVAVSGTITQFWEGDTSKISKAIAQGYKVVNSAQLFTYLDYPYENGLPLWKTYRHHPSPKAENTDIIGFGAQMWTENVPDFQRLCYMTFPRLAGLAECGWSVPANKNYDDFIRRVTPLQQLWRETGVISDQPIYSTKEPNAILPEKYREKKK